MKEKFTIEIKEALTQSVDSSEGKRHLNVEVKGCSSPTFIPNALTFAIIKGDRLINSSESPLMNVSVLPTVFGVVDVVMAVLLAFTFAIVEVVGVVAVVMTALLVFIFAVVGGTAGGVDISSGFLSHFAEA